MIKKEIQEATTSKKDIPGLFFFESLRPNPEAEKRIREFIADQEIIKRREEDMKK